MISSLYALDFLSISLLFDNKLMPKDNLELTENLVLDYNKTKLILTNRRTSNFKHIWNIEINGLIFAELRTTPNKGMLKQNHAILKFKNELLYNGSLASIYKRIKYDLNTTFNKINQIDISLDQVADKNHGKHIKFAYDYIRGNTVFTGQQIIRVDMQKQHIRNVYIGSRSSDKFMRCYYKKRELEVSNKNYIIDYWNKNQLAHENKEVFRSELSIKGSVINHIEIKDLSNENGNYQPFFDEKIIDIIQTNEFLNSVFRSETQKFCTTIDFNEYNTNGKKADRCKKTYIFNHLVLKEPILLLSRLKLEAGKMVHKIKMCTKFLHQIFVETNQDAYRLVAEQISLFEGLLNWKEFHEPSWTAEHNRKMQNTQYKNYFCKFKLNDFIYLPNVIK